MERLKSARYDEAATREEIMTRPICPLTWLTNGEQCVHCSYDCAWFDHEMDACGILTIAKVLRSAGDDTQSIREIAEKRAARDGIL